MIENLKLDNTIINSQIVSIVTPILNGINYLEPCIKSVLTQSYECIEHIFVDGGSTDGTIEMLLKYKAAFPERFTIVLEPDEGPGGIGEAWNKGLKIAKGSIIGWLGGDDMLSGPESIRTVIDYFKTNPQVYFVHGRCNYIDELGKIYYTTEVGPVTLNSLINEFNPISCPSAFYKKEVVEKVGWFNDYGNDLDYWIRVAKIYQIHDIQNILSNFRVHKKSITGNLRTRADAYYDDLQITKFHGSRFFSRWRLKYYYAILRLILPKFFIAPIGIIIKKILR
jgi:glycosyltransferase involved in cell wall biosynthesis